MTKLCPACNLETFKEGYGCEVCDYLVQELSMTITDHPQLHNFRSAEETSYPYLRVAVEHGVSYKSVLNYLQFVIEADDYSGPEDFHNHPWCVDTRLAFRRECARRFTNA